MKPIYIPNWTVTPGLQRLEAEVHWLRVAETRSEQMMAHGDVSYTYGKGRGERTYTSTPFCTDVATLMDAVNLHLSTVHGWHVPMNVCFLNRYLDQNDHLGWHADDHQGTDHTAPVVVVSFGAEREIWWRVNGHKGELPPEHKVLLGNGSLFTMPPGFQFTHQHRIPKAGREVGARISLTFRAFK
jgi:alkylated DNA repair dioxygenase AlkB